MVWSLEDLWKTSAAIAAREDVKTGPLSLQKKVGFRRMAKSSWAMPTKPLGRKESI